MRRRPTYKKCACCLNTYLSTCFRRRGTGRDKLCLQCTKLPPLVRQGKLKQAALEQEEVVYPEVANVAS